MKLEFSFLKCTRKQTLEINICKISLSQFVCHIGFLGAITNTCPTQGVEGVHQKVYTCTLDFKKCTPGAWCTQIKRARLAPPWGQNLYYEDNEIHNFSKRLPALHHHALSFSYIHVVSEKKIFLKIGPF
jgi:hypothetical protein